MDRIASLEYSITERENEVDSLIVKNNGID